MVALPEISRESQHMLTGGQIRDARKRARMSQADLARAVEASPRSVGGWERGEVTPNLAEARLLQVLAPYLDVPTPEDAPALTAASDAELLAEIARRFARTPREEGSGSWHDASSEDSDGADAPRNPFDPADVPLHREDAPVDPG